MEEKNDGVGGLDINEEVTRDFTMNQILPNDEQFVEELSIEPITKNMNQNVVEETPIIVENIESNGTFDTSENKPKRLRMPQIFIGKNYNKLLYRKFSFSGFFFGGLYYMYRKMYLIGILLYVLTMCIILFLPSYMNTTYGVVIVAGFSLLLCITVGFITNKLYISYAKKKLNKIRALNKSYEESAKLCKKQGGTNLPFAFILCVLISASFLFINTMLQDTGVLHLGMGDSDGNPNGGDDSPEIDVMYNGVVEHDVSVTVLDDFTFQIPSDFIDGPMMSPDYIDYIYKSNISPDTYNACNFSIYSVVGYDSPSNLINSMASYFSALDTVTSVYIDGTEYSTFTVVGSTATTYYYSVETKGKVYLISYSIVNGTTKAICEQYHTQIINSIVLNKG